MDDLKSKFLGLIQKQVPTKIPIVGSFSECDIDTEVHPTVNETEVVKEPDRPSDQEILESIDKDYFTVDQSFDACEYKLKKISTCLNIDSIELDLKQLCQQDVVISNQLLQMILEKQTACREEFNRIINVQECVNEIISVVKTGRENLDVATRHFTTASLGILANYRKRTLVQLLLRSLNTLKTLQRTESRLEELLAEGDFPGAIALLQECLGVAAQYRHFTCVTDLSAKLQYTLVMTEEHLDVALAKICHEFNEEVYTKLQSAYFLLGKTQIAMDQLHMHFTSTIHNSAFNVVHSFADLGSQSGSKKQYTKLCQCVSEEKLIPCLLALCKTLWFIVLSYHKVVVWHQNNSQNVSGNCFETNYNDLYVKQKLEAGLTRLWHDVQTRVSSLVLSANLSNYKFDDFLQVLGILHRLSQLGEELCGSDSKEVASSVRTQSSNYFKLYHTARLDDLKVFLENEAWSPCPVRADFTLLHLQEFRGLRCSVEQCAGVITRHDSSLDGSSVGTGFFARFQDPHKSTPFDTNFHIDTRDEEILASIPDDPSGYFSEESDDENEMRECGINNETRDNKVYSKRITNYPLLTNTTLTVLRHCGKYLQMSRLLKSIATEVVTALCQLFEYYLYTVHSFFVTPIASHSQVSSIKLQAVLKRIKENLICSETDEEVSQNVLEAQVSPIVDLSKSENLYGLCERVVAVESLVFLSEQYNFLRPYLEQLLQSQGSTVHHLNQFYTQIVDVCTDVRVPVYSSVAWRAVDTKNAIGMMSKVNWEVKEVISQHSEYVDIILRELQIFSMRLEDMQIAIPDQVSNILWENVAHHLAIIFVEGFSSSKKCTHGGRTLMQLDYTQLISKLEKLSNLRPVPYRDYVEAYVKAYYQSEDELETWIHDHMEYTNKQLLALVSCVCQSNKKTRQKLISIIEDFERSSVR